MSEDAAMNLTFTTSIGWMKDTVITAAEPAIPTCWNRLGAAATEVARGVCCLLRLMVMMVGVGD